MSNLHNIFTNAVKAGYAMIVPECKQIKKAPK
jgi:hypothetical protein